jgi:hypothetical protein
MPFEVVKQACGQSGVLLPQRGAVHLTDTHAGYLAGYMVLRGQICNWFEQHVCKQGMGVVRKRHCKTASYT